MSGLGSSGPTCGWGSAGPEEQWARGRGGYPSELWDPLRARVHRGLVAGIPVGGEPGRMEQRLCRPTGRGFGPAVLVLDRGVVKPHHDLSL
jgi:hypothetical protein